MSKRKQSKEAENNRTHIVPIRFTEEEYEELCQMAEETGKSISEVIRRNCFHKKLYHRLSDKEADALCSLTDARGDLVEVVNALNGTPESLKLKLFGSFQFMYKWIAAINKIIAQWDNIITRLTE